MKIKEIKARNVFTAYLLMMVVIFGAIYKDCKRSTPWSLDSCVSGTVIATMGWPFWLSSKFWTGDHE